MGRPLARDESRPSARYQMIWNGDDYHKLVTCSKMTKLLRDIVDKNDTVEVKINKDIPLSRKHSRPVKVVNVKTNKQKRRK